MKLITLAGMNTKYGRENNAPLLVAAKTLQSSLLAQGGLGNGSVTVAFENLDRNQYNTFRDNMDSNASHIVGVLADAFGCSRDEVQKRYSANQLTAAAIAFEAAANPKAYADAAMRDSNTAVGSSTVLVSAEPGNYGYHVGVHPAFEAFDNSTYTDMMGVSTIFNLEATKQRPLAEAFFPTVTVGPDTGGLDMAIRIPYVYSHFLREVGGNEENFELRRAIDAVFDHTVLADDSLELYPEVLINGDTDEFFFDQAKILPRDLQLRGRKVRTAPLIMGKSIPLINISQYSLMDKNGQYDAIDSLDRAVGVKAVYATMGNDVLKFSLEDVTSAMYHAGAERDGRQLFLNTRTAALQLNAKTLQYNGVDAVTDATLTRIINDDLVVNLRISLGGEVDLETSNASVFANFVKVDSIYNVDGERLPLDTGDGLDIVNAIEDDAAGLVLVAWDPDARVTNLTYAERGLQVNFRDYSERYVIPLGNPISIPSPLAENRGPEEMATLISLLKSRTSSNAITRLFSFANRMEQFRDSETMARGYAGSLESQGIGRHLIREAWYNHVEIDVETIVQTQNSTNKPVDVMNAIINYIRDSIYAMLQTTGLEYAKDLLDGGQGGQLGFVVGTSPLIQRYLQLIGDTRIFGDSINPVFVSDVDDRLIDQIFVAPVVESDGPHPLRFGSHLNIPELISARTAVRNNRTFNEAMVQPRSTHVVHCPVLTRFTVKNLSKVMTEYSYTKIKELP